MSQIIFAADVPSYSDISSLVDKIKPNLAAVKVGPELFVSEGPSVLKEINHSIFLDLKLHDIPETVERAINAASKYNVKFLTIHISQEETLKRAIKAAKKAGIILLGVTVLTSMSERDLRNLNIIQDDAMEKQVLDLADLAYSNGVRGFVCSGQEIELLKDNFEDIILVVPGVRSLNIKRGSQQRVITPREAIERGADYIVVGRQVRDAPDPEVELRKIITEIGHT